MYECFHCGTKSVGWVGDFDFSDYGLEGEGIIHECHCSNCGADITYKIPIPDEEMTECYKCGFNDDDYGCTCPHSDKWYACPIENKKPENIQALQEYKEPAESEVVNASKKS